MIFEPILTHTIPVQVTQEGVMQELPKGVFNASIQGGGGNAKVLEFTNEGKETCFVVVSGTPAGLKAKVPSPDVRGDYPIPGGESRIIKIPSNTAYVAAISLKPTLLFITPGVFGA